MICEKCGNEFCKTENNRSSRLRFCSLKCWYSSMERKVSRKCRICGEHFETIPFLAIRQKTCGKEECRRASYRTGKMVPCATCGKEFWKYRSQPMRNYCSPKCAGVRLNQKVSIKCTNCGKEFIRGRAFVRRVKRPFCSLDCSRQFFRGENGQTWRGGQNKHYRGPDWPQKSKAARKRDGHICQVCGKPQQKGEKLSVDHIIPYRLVKRNDLINLISICRAPCHASKTGGAEADFLRGNILGFNQRLNAAGWPMERVQAAMSWWGSL